MADSDAGIYIINISDPINPILVSLHDTPGFVMQVTVRGNYAYVVENYGYVTNMADDPSGLQILDISNPKIIHIIGQIGEEGIFSIAIEGDYWYTGGPSGIKVFNSTRLSEPVLMNHITEIEDTFVTNMEVIDGFLYASDYYLGFRIFEISNSINLTEIGRNDVGGSPLGFQVVGEIAYVASQIKGIEIIRIQITEANGRTIYLETLSCIAGVFILGLFSRKKGHRRKAE